MAHKVRVTGTFKKALKKKSKEDREQVEDAIEKLSINPRRPGLKTHRIHSAKGVWGARLNKGNRMTFEWDDETIVLRNNCKHDEALRKP